jgi:hypothetical protein
MVAGPAKGDPKGYLLELMPTDRADRWLFFQYAAMQPASL